MNSFLILRTELCLLCARSFVPDRTTADGLCQSCQDELTAACSLISVASSGACDIPIFAVTPYDGPIVQLLEAVKRRGHHRPLRFVARMILPIALDQAQGPLYPVPASRPGRRHRGFDQMRMVAHHSGRSYRSVFVRRSGRQQKELDRAHRLRNAEATLALARLRPSSQLPPGVIIDDVLTTGATITRAVSLLRHVGATPSAAVVIAATL